MQHAHTPPTPPKWARGVGVVGWECACGLHTTMVAPCTMGMHVVRGCMGVVCGVVGWVWGACGGVWWCTQNTIHTPEQKFWGFCTPLGGVHVGGVPPPSPCCMWVAMHVVCGWGGVRPCMHTWVHGPPWCGGCMVPPCIGGVWGGGGVAVWVGVSCAGFAHAPHHVHGGCWGVLGLVLWHSGWGGHACMPWVPGVCGVPMVPFCQDWLGVGPRGGLIGQHPWGVGSTTPQN